MKKDDLGEILNQMNNIINAYKKCMGDKFESASKSSTNINIIACERYKCSTPSDGGSIFSNEQFKLTRAPACNPNPDNDTICDSETGFLDDVYLLESAYNTSGNQNTLGSSIFLGIDAQTEGGKINYVVKAMDNPDDRDSWIKNKFYVLVDNNGKFLFYNIHWNVFLAYDGNKIIGAPKEKMRDLNPQGNSLLPSADGFKFELLKYTNLYISDLADKEEGTSQQVNTKGTRTTIETRTEVDTEGDDLSGDSENFQNYIENFSNIRQGKVYIQATAAAQPSRGVDTERSDDVFLFTAVPNAPVPGDTRTEILKMCIYNVSTGTMEQEPMDALSPGIFEKLPKNRYVDFGTGFDSCMSWKRSHPILFLFKKQYWCAYDTETGGLATRGGKNFDRIHVRGGSGSRTHHFRNMPLPFSHTINVVVNIGVGYSPVPANECAIMITYDPLYDAEKKDHAKWMCWDINYGGVISLPPVLMEEGYTRNISYLNKKGCWADNLPYYFKINRIDSALEVPGVSNEVYFFSSARYVRYRIKSLTLGEVVEQGIIGPLDKTFRYLRPPFQPGEEELCGYQGEIPGPGLYQEHVKKFTNTKRTMSIGRE